MNQKTRGAVIVTRVSTGEQAKHGTSLESQRDACRAKALALNLPIVAEYEDAGISGAYLTLRTGMMQAIADIQEGRADTLICANLSRFSRDVEHQQSIKKALHAAGGFLVFSDMDFADTPEGDLNYTIQGGFAEYERKVFRERAMKGRRKRAQEGQQPTRNRSAFGYHVVTKADVLRGLYPAEQLGRYQVLPEEAEYVREIFARYAVGTDSLNDLARWLNQSGIQTKRKAAYWRATALRVILQNTAYRGEAVFGRTSWHMSEKRLTEINPRTGELYRCANVQTFTPPEDWIKIDCPTLVSAEVWEQANARLTENKRLHGGNPQRVRMLSGLVACEVCGKPMSVCVATTDTRGTRTYHNPERYHCGHDRRTFTATRVHTCPQASFPVPETEQAVILALNEICTRPEVIRQAVEQYSRQNTLGPDRKALRHELCAADKSLHDLLHEETAAVQAQIAGIRAGASPDAYAEVFAQIAARRKDLEDRRGVLAAQIAPPRRAKATPIDAEGLKRQALADVQRVLTSSDVTGNIKRSVVRTVIEKVVCQKEGAEVFFRAGVGLEDMVDDTLDDTLQLMLINCKVCCRVRKGVCIFQVVEVSV